MKHKKMYKTLKSMIEWTREVQEKASDAKKRYSLAAWSKEYSTIKFYLPRKSGHSVFATKLCKKFINPVIILKDQKMLDSFKERFFPFEYPLVKVNNIWGYSKFHDGIIVDNTFLFSKNEIESIYQNMSSSEVYPFQQFIFLQ